MLFAYINTSDDCIQVEIDDSDAVSLKHNKGDKIALWQWIVASTNEDCPKYNQVISVDVELDDDPVVAVHQGNSTIDIWN